MSDQDTSGDRVAADDGPVLDVRAVLDEIGAEGALAQLEARVAGLEQDLERADARAREAENAHRGEFELMRARIDEALDLLRESMEEQRDGFRQFEERYPAMVETAEATVRGYVDELRDDLTPRVQKAVLRTEEVTAELKGEIGAVAADVESRTAGVEESVESARRDLGRLVEELTRAVAAERENRAAGLEALEERFAARLEDATGTAQARHQEQGERIEALRRELDAAVGELRAGANLRAGEFSEAIEDLRVEMADLLEGHDEVAAGLESRWIEGTRDLARRIEQVVVTVREAVAEERSAREQGRDELARRVDEIAGVVEDLHTRHGSTETRQGNVVEQLRRDSEEMGNRIDVLQTKVAQAVSQIASQLTNRVATIAGDLEALREASVRHEERLAAIEHLERRVTELAARREDAPAPAAPGEDPRTEELDREIRATRQELSGVARTVGDLQSGLRELGTTIAAMEERSRVDDGLRQEVRELAARTAEMLHRLDETERLARTAGQAIARAVRRSRESRRTSSAAVDSAAHELAVSADELATLDDAAQGPDGGSADG